MTDEEIEAKLLALEKELQEVEKQIIFLRQRQCSLSDRILSIRKHMVLMRSVNA